MTINRYRYFYACAFDMLREGNSIRAACRLTGASKKASEPNLKALVARGIDGYVAPGRAQHPTAANGKVGGPLTQLMRKKIDDGGFETSGTLRPPRRSLF
jgi:hypothetical protein